MQYQAQKTLDLTPHAWICSSTCIGNILCTFASIKNVKQKVNIGFTIYILPCKMFVIKAHVINLQKLLTFVDGNT